jgi:redox-sensitive bicupin YhaK (pirin superfamily)
MLVNLCCLPLNPIALRSKNMISILRSQERGGADHGWLNTRHTFSFDSYHDPRHMHFRALRVINEDVVQPGAGFPTHPHRDMEIITYVLEGALQHQDSLGNGSIIRPGDGQRMSAGTGILHSEANASKAEPVHLLQIWITPERRGIEPGYEQKAFPEAEKRGRLRLIAARDGQNGAVTVHQDVSLYVALLDPQQKVEHSLAPGRHAWLHVARGSVELNGTRLEQGDGAAISDEQKLAITGAEDGSEVLLFDLA